MSRTTLEFIKAALHEDIGQGDITANLLIKPNAKGIAKVIAKAQGIFFGERLVKEIFKIIDPSVKLEFKVRDGGKLQPGKIVFKMDGSIRSILKAERTMVNFLSHLSGVATQTNRFVRRVRKYGTLILDTRKTTPLWRELEKFAVQVGGGRNHRQGLDEYVMVKENHRAYGNLKKLKTRQRQFEIEVRNIGELKEAIELKPQVILLDNFTPKETKRAVEIARKTDLEIILESSGGICLENVRRFAAAGVDTISVGSLTHSTKAVDFSLLID